MFFVLAKILWIAVAPLNLLLFLMVVALRPWAPDGGRWRHAAWTVLALLLAVGFLPVSTLLLAPLEDRFPPPPTTMAPPTGIIVLGGSTDEVISDARDQVTVVDAATRITTAVALARRFPAARLVFSGGSAALMMRPRTEAEDTKRLWIDLGIAPDRITIEDRSRDTYENALFTRSLIQPKSGERWLLVTSAHHMPRAVGLFRALDFPVIPYPVDYRTAGTWVDWLPMRSAVSGFQRFDMALREWIGLAAYRLAGRIHELFPGPEPDRAAEP